MNIHVLYMGPLRQAAGKSGERVSISASSTMEGLVQHLATSASPPLRRLLVDEQGEMQPALLLFVEDDQVNAARTLRDGDVVTLLSPMAGG
jgi:molybdopterin converting factor small subunit